jgi:hypothetical protein
LITMCTHREYGYHILIHTYTVYILTVHGIPG